MNMVYQRHWVHVIHCSLGPYCRAILSPKDQNKSKLGFSMFLRNKLYNTLTWDFLKFIRTTIKNVWIMGSGAPEAHDKRPDGTKFAWDASWRLLGWFSQFESHVKVLDIDWFELLPMRPLEPQNVPLFLKLLRDIFELLLDQFSQITRIKSLRPKLHTV